MTEYKKLTEALTGLTSTRDSLELLHRDDFAALTLATPEGRQTIGLAYSSLEKAMETMASCSPRMEKMLVRARERDPDKQIYNESMCEKIEAMVAQYEEVVNSFEPLKDPILSNYYELVEWESESTERRAKTEEGLRGVENDEGRNRVLVLLEESRAHKVAAEWNRSNLHRIDEEERIRAEAKWRRELARRQQEVRLAEEYDTNSATEFRKALDQLLSMPVEDSLGLHKSKVVLALHELVAHILRHPEDEGVHSLRNNNPLFVQRFGHPCFRCSPLVEGEHTEEAHHHGDFFYPIIERILYMVGFRPSYSKVPAPSPQPGLVCSTHSSPISYVPLGFEDYGERALVLQEPDATEDSANWIQWFDKVNGMSHKLNQAKAPFERR